MDPPQYSHCIFTFIFSNFTWKCFFCSCSCAIVSSPKYWLFSALSTFDKSISGLTDLISPIFTRRSYLLLTVGVLTFIWREIARKDFLSSSINDFRIATSVSSRSRGKVLYYSIVTAITRFNYYEEEFEVAIA
jgi:hypothetical protein